MEKKTPLAWQKNKLFPLLPAAHCTLYQWWAQIFEYLNKKALEYYSYSYSCHFPSTNMFGYSFVDFWTTKYIQIFVCKFFKILIYLNIWIYSDIHSLIFGQPNIFENSFVNSSKFSYIWIFAQNLILMFAYLFLMKKSIVRYSLCIQKYPV